MSYRRAKVVWARPNQVFNVGECYNVSFAVAHAYARRMKRDPRYNGGILCVVSMTDNEQSTRSL